MARPINADAAATRLRILQQAGELFSQHGVDGCSVREIAKASDVSLAMVHHYYGSKSELYKACIEAMYEELSTLRVELLASAGSSLDALVEDAVRRTFRFGCQRRSTVRLLLRTVVSSGQLPPGKLHALHLPFLGEASALLAQQTGRPAATFRLPLQTMVFLSARYSVAELSELRQVVCGDAEHAPTEDETLRRVEDHLVDAARKLLALEE